MHKQTSNKINGIIKIFPSISNNLKFISIVYLFLISFLAFPSFAETGYQDTTLSNKFYKVLLRDNTIIYGTILKIIPSKEIILNNIEGEEITVYYKDIKKFTEIKMEEIKKEQSRLVALQDTSLVRQLKNPTTAAILSLLIPTSGHIYAKKYKKGFLFLGSELAAAFLIYAGRSHTEESNWIEMKGSRKDVVYQIKEWDTKWYFYAGIAGLISLKIWEMYDSSSCVKMYNDELIIKLGARNDNSIFLNLSYNF